MLDLQERKLLRDALRPPVGYEFDQAIISTFSLDLMALLTVPLAFTFFQLEDQDGPPQTDPLAMLEALRRYARKVTVFCQAGQIAVPCRTQLLLGYLENTVHEVTAPRGGVFHPKVSVLRYVRSVSPESASEPAESPEGAEVVYRLLCGSRNLTFDCSWDTLLVLEGDFKSHRQKAIAFNHPLADFVTALPGFCVQSLTADTRAMMDSIVAELRRVDWQIPDGFDELSFVPIGIGEGSDWPFAGSTKVLAMAPFVDDRFLARLAKEGAETTLVSRFESLEGLLPKSFAGVDAAYYLNPAAEPEGEDTTAPEADTPAAASRDSAGTPEPDRIRFDPSEQLQGLHAKLFIADEGWHARVWTGSANATEAAFTRNVEFLIELRGKRSQIGVKAFIGDVVPEGQTTEVKGDRGLSFADLLQRYVRAGPAKRDTTQQKLDALLLEARTQLAAARLEARVSVAPDAPQLHTLQLRAPTAITLPTGVTATCRPITLRETAALPLASPLPTDVAKFAGLSFEAITSFFAFHLVATVDGIEARVAFVTNLPLIGAPQDRSNRILLSLLKNRQQLLRYLLMLLADNEAASRQVMELMETDALRGGGETAHDSLGLPLLEPLLQTLDRHPERLEQIARLIEDLQATDEGRALLTDDFLSVWALFGRCGGGATPMAESACPDMRKAIDALKVFQRRSTDYVFERLYGSSPTRRFLLADEVGLGKTLVARGVIARAIEHLWKQGVPDINVVYICSNQDIGRQNIKRLNPTNEEVQSPLDRITLLPRPRKNDPHEGNRRLNLIAITPGTSLDPKGGGGRAEERVLLFHMLKAEWQLDGVAPMNVLQMGASPERFRGQVDWFTDYYRIDAGVAAQFLAAVRAQPDLRRRFAELCAHYARADSVVDSEISDDRYRLVGELREVLAKACIRYLQPHLIILDEFQRFRDLLDPNEPTGELAHELFEYSDKKSQARVLLLSATPYKMRTLAQEEFADEENHQKDFLLTLKFLFSGDKSKVDEVEDLLGQYRQGLYRLGEPGETGLASARDRLTACLRSVVCRTERLAVTADRSGMLREVLATPTLGPTDIVGYLHTQRLARELGHTDTMEYWKSAPYLLNFMDAYKLKDRFREECKDPAAGARLASLLSACPRALLPWDQVEGYTPLNAPNARLRELARSVLDANQWQCLWIPPSLPYYAATTPYAAIDDIGFTKRLVFSSWQVVPKAIATLLSYEAERRMITLGEPAARNTAEDREKRRPLLNFSLARTDGRFRGMPVLALLYPSSFLAGQCDPLELMLDQNLGRKLELNEVLGLAEMAIAEKIEPIVAKVPTGGREDESWYWAAPILLDQAFDPEGSKAWWDQDTLAAAWRGKEPSETEGSEDRSAWDEHVDEAKSILGMCGHALGRVPEDLVPFLAQLAVGGPAVCALRSLARVTTGGPALTQPAIRCRAGQAAWGFRSLFNLPDVTQMVRGLKMRVQDPYWRRVLEYCVAGNLQSTLDEYAHVLLETQAHKEASPEKVAADIVDALRDALLLRVAQPGVDRIRTGAAGGVEIEKERLRSRFAMRFGDETSDDGSTVYRADQVRQAFNSPFWPFVLITTSVGQEGLDFHPYCHAVVHWNLPSNPVDLEQREGRVHRYKGHAVRRNVALAHGHQLVPNGWSDPWQALFATATTSPDDSLGLRPFWVYPHPSGVAIERHVLALPLSRESDLLPALRRSLAVYRMVFGQPRQDDLVEYLLSRLPREAIDRQLDQLRIDLTPPDGSVPVGVTT